MSIRKKSAEEVELTRLPWLPKDDSTDGLIKNWSPHRVIGLRLEPDPEVWLGKDYELARKVRDELGRKKFSITGEFTGALKDACARYRRKDGTKFTPKSLRESLRQIDCPKCWRPRKGSDCQCG